MGEGYEYRDALPDGRLRGRGAGVDPGNRFEGVRLHVLGEHLDAAAREAGGACARRATQVLTDDTKKVIHKVDSPDMGMSWTVNPYRGCEHGCIYCYARPYHEYLGLSSGIDFETRIIAKHDAPRLLARELAKPSWHAEPVVMSGITDCWQPIESELRIARGCLEVLAQCRQPVTLITKNRLILRDLDLIEELHRYGAIHVAVSLTTLDNALAAKMEPRASSPADRLHTISRLAAAGVPVTVMTAPIIPGLTDRELPRLLEAAAGAGATSAGYVLLRLPWQIKALFLDWLGHHFPGRAKHVEMLIRDAHGGKLYDPAPGVRRRGRDDSPIAQQIGGVFRMFRRRYGLDRGRASGAAGLSNEHFRRPTLDGQRSLF